MGNFHWVSFVTQTCLFWSSLATDRSCWPSKITNLSSFILYFVYLESVICAIQIQKTESPYFNENCRHRPMYSSHVGIPVNVDPIFVASVEPLLLKYQVRNHTWKLKLNYIRLFFRFLTTSGWYEKKWPADLNTLTIVACFGFWVCRWIWFSLAMYTTMRGLVQYTGAYAKASQRRMQVELILMTTANIPRLFMPLLELEGLAWTSSLRLW